MTLRPPSWTRNGEAGLGGLAFARQMTRMSRPTIALLAGLGCFVIYVMVVVALADHVLPHHWVVQLLYFTLAGVAWVWPARALMFWGAGGRQP